MPENQEESSSGETGRGKGGMLAGARWSLGGRLLEQGLRLAVVIVLARFLAPDSFGLIAMAHAVLGLPQLFLDLGTGQAVVHEETLEAKLLSSVFWLNLATGIAAAVLVWLLAPPICLAFAEPRLAPLLRALAPTLVIASLRVVHGAVLMRAMRFDRLAKATFAGTVAYALASAGSAAKGMGVWSLVIGEWSAVVVSTMLICLQSGWQPALHFNRADIRRVSRFSANLSLYNATNYVFNQADRLIVGRLLGAAAMGYYSMTQRLTTRAVRPIATAVDPVIFSALSGMRDNERAMRRAFLRSTAGLSLVLFPCLIGAGLVARPLVLTFFGERWLPLVPLIAILAPVAAFSTVAGRVGTLFRALGRTELLFRLGLARGVASVLGLVAGVPWGVAGVAAGGALARLVLLYPSVAIPLRLIGLSPRDLGRATAPCLLATAVMAVALLAAQQGLANVAPPPIVLAAALASGSIAYAGVIAALRPPALGDLLDLLFRWRRSRPMERDA